MYRRRAVTVDAMQFTVAATITLTDGRQVDVPEGNYGLRNADGAWSGVVAKDFFEREYEEISEKPAKAEKEDEEKPVRHRAPRAAKAEDKDKPEYKDEEKPEPLFAFKPFVSGPTEPKDVRDNDGSSSVVVDDIRNRSGDAR